MDRDATRILSVCFSAFESQIFCILKIVQPTT